MVCRDLWNPLDLENRLKIKASKCGWTGPNFIMMTDSIRKPFALDLSLKWQTWNPRIRLIRSCYFIQKWHKEIKKQYCKSILLKWKDTEMSNLLMPASFSFYDPCNSSNNQYFYNIHTIQFVYDKYTLITVNSFVIYNVCYLLLFIYTIVWVKNIYKCSK